jgi:nicotinamidase/pyrazinamidase
MKVSDYIFWNVDTQFDFVLPNGKLYVSGAELLKTNWEKLTQLAKNNLITVVNTADWHYPGSAELSTIPDFVKTFPQHCIANSAGAEYIEETKPENPFIINWETENYISKEVVDSKEHRNFIIRKDAFDVFKGNPYTEHLLELLSPETIVVYGVTTNVCVNDAVVGLAKRGKNVIVVENAVKELPNIPLPFENWEKLGVKMMKLDNIEKMIQS